DGLRRGGGVEGVVRRRRARRGGGPRAVAAGTPARRGLPRHDGVDAPLDAHAFPQDLAQDDVAAAVGEVGALALGVEREGQQVPVEREEVDPEGDADADGTEAEMSGMALIQRELGGQVIREIDNT
ncbi:hypothetical protein ACSNOI_36250, partial [Actinomadura kijaniata]